MTCTVKFYYANSNTLHVYNKKIVFISRFRSSREKVRPWGFVMTPLAKIAQPAWKFPRRKIVERTEGAEYDDSVYYEASTVWGWRTGNIRYWLVLSPGMFPNHRHNTLHWAVLLALERASSPSEVRFFFAVWRFWIIQTPPMEFRERFLRLGTA